MARISARVAGFALIVLSIGFNIWRYPMVWEMAGTPVCVSSSDEAAPLVSTSRPETVAASPRTEPPTVALMTPRVEPANLCSMPPTDMLPRAPEQRADLPPTEQLSQPPDGYSPTDCETLSSAEPVPEVASDKTLAVAAVGGRLVPVVRLTPVSHHMTGQQWGFQPDMQSNIQEQPIRLPPLDHEGPAPSNKQVQTPYFSSNPVYPVTGF